MTEETTSEILKALETVYNAWIRKRHPDARPAVFVIYHSDVQRGHIWFESWTRTRDNGRIDEIHIASPLLDEGPESILRTMLHEAAHSIARTRDIQDTSRGNRYHNKRFKQLAEEVGLITAKDPGIGYLTIDLTDATRQDYRFALDHLAGAITVKQSWIWTATTAGSDGENPAGEDDPDDDEDQPKKNRQLKAICACRPPRILRLARKTFELAPITCGACSAEFAIDE